MRSFLAFFSSLIISLGLVSAQSTENDSIERLFDCLCAFDEVEVANIPTADLYEISGGKPEIDIELLHHLLEKAKIEGKNKSEGISFDGKKTKEYLSIVHLSNIASLSPDKRLFMESLFTSDKFKDATLTMKMKEDGDCISVFVPQVKDNNDKLKGIYIFLISNMEYYAIRLEGSYIFQTNWRIAPQSRQEIKKKNS